MVLVAKCKTTLFLVLLIAKNSHPDWFLLSQMSYLLVKKTKNKVVLHFATRTKWSLNVPQYQVKSINMPLTGNKKGARERLF
jgi:hypothetical protein